VHLWADSKALWRVDLRAGRKEHSWVDRWAYRTADSRDYSKRASRWAFLKAVTTAASKDERMADCWGPQMADSRADSMAYLCWAQRWVGRRVDSKDKYWALRRADWMAATRANQMGKRWVDQAADTTALYSGLHEVVRLVYTSVTSKERHSALQLAE
jgi:hypothetical protein